MGVIVGFIVFAIIYSLIHNILSKITGDEKKAYKVIEFLFTLLGVLFSGYIVFWFVYSTIVTWG